jgi:hypothetical protein
MAKIDNKTADVATLLDDLVATMLNHSSGNYTDADPALTNGGGSGDWEDNARVVEHSPSGQYLLFWVFGQHNGTGNAGAKGVAFNISNDWDSSNHHPAGKTMLGSDTPVSNDVGNLRQGSFTTTNEFSYSSGQPGLFPLVGDYSGTRTERRTLPCSYQLSVTAGGFNAACWNTQDGTQGQAAVLSYEYVGSKFWADGQDPWVSMLAQSGDGGFQAYGWRSYASNGSLDKADQAYATAGSNGAGQQAIEAGEWGLVNPDSNDDTFFFRRPVIYQTSQWQVPVAYVEDLISNDREEGAASGDIVTYDGTDYRMFRKSGAAQSTPVTLGMRWE